MKLGFIGMGFVGGATAKALERFHKILIYDKYKKEYDNPLILKDAEVVFVCVPTPMRQNGEIDLSAIYDSLETLKEITKSNEKKPLVVIRSTVIPGTSDKLEQDFEFNFVSNPEFLREKHAIYDMENTNRIVFGTERKEDYDKILEVFKPVFPNINYIFVDKKTAEMIKYSSNVMLIGQVAIANELFQICKLLKIDYSDIKNTLLLDSRMAKNISVPGPDGKLGFGGKCFPKDLNALRFFSKQLGYNPSLLDEIWKTNGRIRENKDWLNIPGATSENNNF